ncbi:hypothetical protein [Bradyrhizobium sp. CCGUVB23]|uniref:hypothetical protein n=1 Tax=Bradyrhizobium sp. CCGUVB23 TaxID=2949630 RepID=UPI0020B1B89E|nr:hypothetical protein [Bradyrhizobium sp. CCGUVB23]MCP3459768.1 hypothetical protein [Bradyrhizobium sp. CCGUVB23]
MLRAVLIATSVAMAMPCFAQQVRVIAGDIQHVYGPGGELLDNAELQAQNRRAWERMQTEKQIAIERRQAEIQMQQLKLQESALAYAPYSDAPMVDPYGGWWAGGGFIGPARGKRIRGSPRIGARR